MLAFVIVKFLLLTVIVPKSTSVSIGIRFAYSELTALSPVFVQLVFHITTNCASDT